MATQVPAVVGQPQTLLSAVSTTGVSGYILDMWPSRGGFPLHITWTTLTTASPATVTINLEGSIDGTNWYQLDQSVSTSGEMRTVINKAVRWLRANLTTLASGTMTCMVMVVAP